MHTIKMMYFHNRKALNIRQIEFMLELHEIKNLKPIEKCDIIWLEYLIKDMEATDKRINNDK